MRKILLNVAVTLDGFIEGPNGEYDWCFTDEDYGMTAFTGRTDAMLLGRKSYELLLNMDKDAWAGTHKRYVVSSTLEYVENAELIRGELRQAVQALKDQEGKDIWLFGGARLTASLLGMALVDELHLSIHPLLLGQGKSLFENSPQRTGLELIDSQTYSSGLVQLIYGLKHS